MHFCVLCMLCMVKSQINCVFLHPTKTKMSILHLFNPEHDIALAANLSNFTAPRAGRVLRSELGFLPLIWADADDVVMVDDVEKSRRLWQQFCSLHEWWLPSDCVCRSSQLCQHNEVGNRAARIDGVSPWGWDRAVCRQLERADVGACCLPSSSLLDEIRRCSHRRTSARLLSMLQQEDTTGVAYECREVGDVERLLAVHQCVVVKAPWSSSGRGVRFFAHSDALKKQQRWVESIVRRQQSVMVEPYYNKVFDFGMEFSVDEDGQVHYLGLSLFQTIDGAYIGNLLMKEELKRECLMRYISVELLDAVRSLLCQQLPLLLPPAYRGPLGIDMMVVMDDDSQMLLHPCVELNLRRTMGHVALALSQLVGNKVGVMQVGCGTTCSLHIVPRSQTDEKI